MNRFTKLCALCAMLLMSVTAFAGDLTGYQFPEWNECDNIVLTTNENSGWRVDSENPSRLIGSSDILTASFMLETDASLFFLIANGYARGINVYVDGELYFNSSNFYMDITPGGYYIDLPSGMHTVQWVPTYSAIDMYYIGIRSTKNTYTVHLLEPGSLGTEILYQDGVERIQDVSCLKVIGKMNDNDFSTLYKMKDNLFYLDLSEAEITEIPEKEFYGAVLLHRVILPEGIKGIGKEAFCFSSLTEINFPATLTTLGNRCFYCSKLRDALINDGCLSLGTEVFAGCRCLRKVNIPNALEEIKYCCFNACYNLCDFTLPMALTSIGAFAFAGTNLEGVKQEIVIPNGVTYIDGYAFEGSGYQSVVLPASYHVITGSGVFKDCAASKYRLESPSVVLTGVDVVGGKNHADITLEVPDFLVNYYKQADYWYDFGNIVGYETAGTREWIIRGDLLLDQHNRFSDRPNVTLKENAGMKVIGSDGMALGDMTVESGCRFISNTDNDITVTGKLSANLYMNGKTWYYLSLPFNMKVGNMAGTGFRAVRRYDGACRAANGTGNNWKNCQDNDIIPAGTGFIVNVSETGWWSFPSQDDESKQYLTANKMFVKQLEENPSATASDRGWNLVGNPYQCWYNIHRINFTAPITVSNGRNYEAYSIIDDDYALAPNQAFFVQCPEGTSEISFPLNGRQMTSVIESQNGVRPQYAGAAVRRLADVTLGNGDVADRTRVVLNEEAGMGYDVECDASKFLADAGMPQIYTLDAEGTQYAINERPVGEDIVPVELVIPESGVYTLSLTRNTVGSVLVIDNEAGKTVDLAAGGYSFHAEAGTVAGRFSLKFAADMPTGINAAEAIGASQGIYTMAGAYVGNSVDGLPAGAYIMRNGVRTSKVVVK